MAFSAVAMCISLSSLLVGTSSYQVNISHLLGRSVNEYFSLISITVDGCPLHDVPATKRVSGDTSPPNPVGSVKEKV